MSSARIIPVGTRVIYDVPDELEDTAGTVTGDPDQQGATPVRWDDTGEVEVVHADVLVIVA